jgi:ribosomal protein S18 acetylase RimI-like enzyme
MYLDKAYNIPTTTSHINNPSQDFIVATTTNDDEGKVIGFAVLARGNSYPCLEHLPATEIIELSRIYIYPEFHGRGVGRLLMGELDGRARKEGKKWMWLGCYEGNERAKGVYEKAGFERVGERSVVLGKEVHMDMVMVKEL